MSAVIKLDRSDNKVLKLLDTVDGYIALRKEFHALLKEAYFSLTQAKYSSFKIPNTAIKVAQSNIHVAVVSEDNQRIFLMETKNPYQDIYKANGKRAIANLNKKTTIMPSISEPSDSLPKNLGTGNHLCETYGAEINFETSTIGRLPTLQSPSVRGTKKHFSQAVLLGVKLCNLRLQILSLLQAAYN